jgi:hypothetical protein
MKNIATVLLIIAVGVLGLLSYLQRIDLEQQRRQVQELTAKLDSAPKIASLDIQEQCLKQAEQFPPPRRNHYNTKLGKCFVLQYNFSAFAPPGYKAISKGLHDAFEEDKSYAEFYWMSEKSKNHSDVPPETCRVTLPSGGETICHSLDEFDALVKQYME